MAPRPLKLFKEVKGKCSLCGVVGQGNRDFICEQCGNPELAVIYCENCGERIYLSETDRFDSIWQFFCQHLESLQKQEMKGLSIRVSLCPLCQALKRGHEPLKILVYKIRVKKNKL